MRPKGSAPFADLEVQVSMQLLPGALCAAMFSAVLPHLAAQGSRFAAVFAGEGSITWPEFYTELARRHRGKSLGKEALEHLIEKRLVTLEARARKIDVPGREVDARIGALRQQLAAQKLSLEKHLDGRGMSMAEFRDYVRLSLLYDRVARSDLGLAPGAPLTADKRKLWLREKQRKHGAIDKVKELPPGVAALVGKERISLAELGKAMARNLVADERLSLLRQMIAYRLLAREAAAREIAVTEADHDAALARKRAEFASDPQYKKAGITLEGMLHAQGRSLADLRDGEVFRAEVLISALGARMFPDDGLKQEYEKEIILWQGRIGASRETHRLLVQGPPRRPLEEARKLCAKVRTAVRQPQDFAPAARRFSEDKASKRRGGNLGFLHRREHGVDERLLKAAFSMRVGVVSQPVEDGDGYSLLLVTKTQAGPVGDARWAAMRQWKVAAWLRQLVQDSQAKYFPLPKS